MFSNQKTIKPELILAIGIPASGKSSLLKKFAEKHGAFYVSSDSIRKQLTGDEADQSENRKVWQLVEETVRRSLDQRRPVVLDATMVKKDDRETYIKLAREYGALVTAVVFDVPLEVALERNRQRERTVPENVLHNMYELLQEEYPTLTEGFNRLLVINEHGELIEEHVSEHTGEYSGETKRFR